MPAHLLVRRAIAESFPVCLWQLGSFPPRCSRRLAPVCPLIRGGSRLPGHPYSAVAEYCTTAAERRRPLRQSQRANPSTARRKQRSAGWASAGAPNRTQFCVCFWPVRCAVRRMMTEWVTARALTPHSTTRRRPRPQQTILIFSRYFSLLSKRRLQFFLEFGQILHLDIFWVSAILRMWSCLTGACFVFEPQNLNCGDSCYIIRKPGFNEF